MTSLDITGESIPRLDGKVAVITGAASGIGFAAATILVSRGATVHILDIKPRDESELANGAGTALPNLVYHQCDIASWAALRDVFDAVGRVDIAVANAGVSTEQHTGFFDDAIDAQGRLVEPDWGLVHVNYTAVLSLVKLSWSSMRRHGVQGSIVVTASVSSYMTELALPVYSSAKAALIALVRSLRPQIIRDNITLNAVAPSGTITPSMAPEFYAPMIDKGVVLSDAITVGLAIAYSATAEQSRAVDVYGKDEDTDLYKSGRWHGRCILTLGKTFTEIEGPLADLRPFWFGRDNVRHTRVQQATIDPR